MKYLSFKIGAIEAAIESVKVQEILPYMSLSRPPTIPPVVTGFLSYDGKAIPVLDLNRLIFNHESSPELTTHILVTRQEAKDDNPAVSHTRQIAYLVDRVTEIRNIDEEQCTPLLEEETFNGCIRAQYSTNGQAIHIFAPERALTAAEESRLEVFCDLAETRLNVLEAPSS